MMIDWVKRVHSQINELVSYWFDTPRSSSTAKLRLECNELTPAMCGVVAQHLARGKARCVSVDCLCFNERAMDCLLATVPVSKIEFDYTELFRVPRN